jgi:hypothetical protein
MQNRKSSLYLAVVASAGLLAATPALAQDAAPSLSCSTPNGYSIVATGPAYVSCGVNNQDTCTQIIYDISGGTPDHVATFVRAEAGPVAATGSFTQTTPCGGDSVIGVAAGAVCHERIARFNNQSTKGSRFTLTVNGRRKPLTTSVVVKKGSNQGACRIVGFGLLDTTGGDACVSSCGNFNVNQTVRKIESFKFKDCEVSFEFDPNTGAIVPNGFTLVAGNCALSEGPSGALTISGPGIFSDSEQVTFGDGFVSSGGDSCTTRIIGGKYYTVCR